MKKFIVASAVLALMLVAAPVQAAGLTEVQIQAIVSLVSSFGADATTVKSVEASLRGQATSGTNPNTSGGGVACLRLYNDLSIGSTNVKTGGEVSKLQQFLLDVGMYPEAQISGYFGPATSRALQKWQAANGIAITTVGVGSFGPKTRAAMTAKCNQAPVISAFTGPTNLTVNQIGTWQATVTDSENDKLSYVVRWGDEANPMDLVWPFNWPKEGFATAYSGTTYTHAYSKPGTYEITMYVIDSHEANIREKKTSVIVR